MSSTRIIPSLSKLTNKSRKKYVSYPRFVSCALEVLLGSDYTQDESFGSSPSILNLERNKQLAGIRFPSTLLDDGTCKSQLLPEGKNTDPKDSEGNDQPADKGLPSMASKDGTSKTKSLLEGPHRDKDLEGFKPPSDMEPLTTPVVDLSGTDAKRALVSTTKQKKPESSHAQEATESDSDSSCPKVLKRCDNVLPLTERQLIQYLQKASQALYNRLTEDQWDKHVEAAASYADLKREIC
ncbi:hypothetical protein Tco_0873206 [Tanacetum coccineum]